MKVTIQHINEDVIKAVHDIKTELADIRYDMRNMNNDLKETRRLFSCLVELITNAQKDTAKKKK